MSSRPEAQNPAETMRRQTVELLGVTVDCVDTAGLLEKVLAFTDQAAASRVMYVNTDCMLLARENDEYRQVLNRADLVYADGIGVVYGARLWGHVLPGRSTGADFMPRFCRVFAQKGLRVYFLGAREGVARKAAEKLCADIPGLQIVGTRNGYFSPDEEPGVIAAINAARPDIVLVGFGAPGQELWIDRNAAKIDARVVWGVGGLFDFLSGRTPRGPQWLLDNGFEWLCRLVAEPRRLWRRYLIGNTRFVLCLLKERVFPG
jgi:N-acetylglucosaminyldiphosphoundecaprenol N-acetyl-beta-D-mannosaminyltransferase